MCAPAAVGLGIMAAGAVAKGIGARKTAKAQAKASIASTNYTMANFANQANLNNTKYAQEVESANQQQQQVYLENLKQKATAQTSAAGNGVAGVSIDSLFKGYDRTTALSNFIGERNIRNMGLQYDANYEALRTNAMNSLYGVSTPTGESTGANLMTNIGGILQSSAASSFFNKLGS